MSRTLVDSCIWQFPCRDFSKASDGLQDLIITGWQQLHKKHNSLGIIKELNCLCNEGFDVVKDGHKWEVYVNFYSKYDDKLIGSVESWEGQHYIDMYCSFTR